ncbi:MAG: DUF6252 family protein [Winogradskyella sp.]|uniref:DUF6252 family protein n=1 Tax=Winogradskyella sp. TaxID=1883156 RepID=UPI00385859B4
MKVVTTILFMTLAILSSSCNDDEEIPASMAGANSFFAKIDGVNYNPPSVTGFRYESINTILLTGATGTNEEQIQFTIPKDIEPGTYTVLNDPLASTFIQAFYAPPTSQEAGDDGFANQGNMMITLHDTTSKTIEGNFSFTTDVAMNSGDSWTITEGSFKITYSDL